MARLADKLKDADPAKFSEAMRHMDALIQRHIGEINKMEDEK